MTAQQEAYQLIDAMPEDKVRALIDFMHRFIIEREVAQTSKVRVDENTRVANFKKLTKIAELQDGWNGNDAKAISPIVIERARDILEKIEYQPEVFPTTCNSIRFAYDMQDGGRLEIEVSENDLADCFLIDSLGDESSETIRLDPILINKRVEEFYG